MTEEEQHRQKSDAGVDGVQDRLDQLDNSLMDEIHEDVRLQSGVPESQSASDLDFIQMTGLTRPAGALNQTSAVSAVDAVDMDPMRPLNFYEKGVGDVDVSADPVTISGGGIRDDDLITMRSEPSSVAGLKEIIAELTNDPSSASSSARQAGPSAEPESVGATAPGEMASAPVTVSPLTSDLPTDEISAKALDSSADAKEPPGKAQAKTDTPPVETAPPSTTHAPDLAEAEAFIRELQEQPRESEDLSAATALPGGLSDDTAALQSEYEFPSDDETLRDGPVRRSGRSRRSRFRKRLMRWSLRLIALGIVALVAFYSWNLIDRALWRPERLYYEAVDAAADGRHLVAAQKFESFAQRNPNNMLRPEAEFRAAYEQLQVATLTPAEREQSLVHAIDLLQIFVAQNPGHEKIPRARSLMGIVSFRLDRYEDAIGILRDPALRADDPDTALAALRILGRSYGALGDIDEARRHYLDAALFEANYTSDRDYRELGDLYAKMAEKSDDPTLRKKYTREALAFWDSAIMSPTMDPGGKAALKRRKEILLNEPAREKPVASATQTSVQSSRPVAQTPPPPTPRPAVVPKAAPQAPPKTRESAEDDSFLIDDTPSG